MALGVLAYNIKRFINIMGIGPLIAALTAASALAAFNPPLSGQRGARNGKIRSAGPHQPKNPEIIAPDQRYGSE